MSNLRERLSVLIPDSVAERVAAEYLSPRALFSATEPELLAHGIEDFLTSTVWG